MSSAEDVSFRTESYSVAVGQASDVKESSFIKAFSTATATKAAVDRPSSTPGNDNSKDSRVESEVNVETPQQITPSSYRKYTEKLGWLWLFLSFWPLFYVLAMSAACKRFRDWDRSGIDFGLFQLYEKAGAAGEDSSSSGRVNTSFEDLLALSGLGTALWTLALILAIASCCGCGRDQARQARHQKREDKVVLGQAQGASGSGQKAAGSDHLRWISILMFLFHVVLVLFCTVISVGPSWISVQHMKHSDNKPTSYASDTFQNIAIIGGGAAGTGAAMSFRQLPHRYNYTIYETEPELGGHAYAPPFHYVDSMGNNATFYVDMGFIFGPTRTYRAMRAFLNRMGIDRTMSKLSVSTTIGDATTYATDDPAMLDPELAARFHVDIEGVDVDSLWVQLLPFGIWLDDHGYDEDFRQRYLTPLLSTLFITKTGLYAQSTAFMAAMFNENKWLDLYHAHPAWVVKGSSRAYYDALQVHLGDPDGNGKILYSTPVRSVTKLGNSDSRGKIKIVTVAGETAYYDGVVFGVAANVAKDLLAAGGTSNPFEQFTLGQIAYDSEQRIVLHTDESPLPTDPAKQRHFNYWAAQGVNPNSMAEFELVGDMFSIFDIPEANRSGGSQGDNRRPILHMNPLRDFDTSTIVDEKHWEHHSQDILHLIISHLFTPHVQDPDNGVVFAGDWVMFIGHSSAIEAGIRAAFMLGARQQLEGYDEDTPPEQQCRAVADVDGTGASANVRAACQSVAATELEGMCSAAKPENAVADDGCEFNPHNSQCEHNIEYTVPFWLSDYNQNISKACNSAADNFAQACRSAADHLGPEYADSCEWQCTQYASVDPYPECPGDASLTDDIDLCFRKDSQYQEYRTQCGDHGFQANILEEQDLDLSSMDGLVKSWHGFAVWYIIMQFCVLFFMFFYIVAMVYTQHSFQLPEFFGI